MTQPESGTKLWREHRFHFALDKLADIELNEGRQVPNTLTQTEAFKIATKVIFSIYEDIAQAGDAKERDSADQELKLLYDAIHPTKENIVFENRDTFLDS